MAKKKKEVEDFEDKDVNADLRGDGDGGYKKRKKLISGAKFHDFEQDPMFVGTLLDGVVVRERDSPDGTQKAGSVMGYNFVTRDGEHVIIGSSHSIEKAVSMIEVGDSLEIVFKGKEKSASGKPFNRFDITQIDL